MKTLYMPTATKLQDIFTDCRAGIFNKGQRQVKYEEKAGEYFCSISQSHGVKSAENEKRHFLYVKPSKAFFDALGPLTYGGSFEIIFWDNGKALVLCNALWDTRMGSSAYWLAFIPADDARAFINTLEA